MMIFSWVKLGHFLTHLVVALSSRKVSQICLSTSHDNIFIFSPSTLGIISLFCLLRTQNYCISLIFDGTLSWIERNENENDELELSADYDSWIYKFTLSTNNTTATTIIIKSINIHFNWEQIQPSEKISSTHHDNRHKGWMRRVEVVDEISFNALNRCEGYETWWMKPLNAWCSA